MIHAGAVASSPAELDGLIARTDDLRQGLTDAGYGSAFGADDLFPLFEAFVAKATAATTARSPARAPMRLWIASIVVAAIVVAVIVAFTIAS